ncbi:MAG: hypothetical protein CL663_02110 [Bacteroidetes bacterium]|nr:hypothetical protein [Bacteroidota bacterium]|tara:strand:+ start:596 stop:1321 length:726 start_codon:yes stop_codon:yes gene_type:complete
MELIFLICILIAAVLYSSVGHGGASGYLALMAIFSFPPELMKVTALTLNLFVASIAFFAFYKAGHFKFKLLWPFVITSVPFSFLGGLIDVEPKLYKIILGICLLFATFRIFYKHNPEEEKCNEVQLVIALVIGALLGFFSGLIGIGGGIILSPLLLLLKWGNLKEVAAVSAVFIFLNSASGLFGHFLRDVTINPNVSLYIIAGVLGGIIGGNMGSFKFSNQRLSYFLAFVLFIASIKLFLV